MPPPLPPQFILPYPTPPFPLFRRCKLQRPQARCPPDFSVRPSSSPAQDLRDRDADRPFSPPPPPPNGHRHLFACLPQHPLPPTSLPIEVPPNGACGGGVNGYHSGQQRTICPPPPWVVRTVAVDGLPRVVPPFPPFHTPTSCARPHGNGQMPVACELVGREVGATTLGGEGATAPRQRERGRGGRGDPADVVQVRSCLHAASGRLWGAAGWPPSPWLPQR